MAERLSNKTDKIEITIPSASASSDWTRPDGIGRSLVRFMTASISRSYHWLIAPDAPAPAAMANKEIAPSNNDDMVIGASFGAKYMPAKPVKITRLITRGFIS